MFDDWLDILARGLLELNLPSFTLNFGQSLVCRGTGQVTWREGGRVRVQGSTDGAQALLGHFGQPLGVEGLLIPHEMYVTASGRTQDGWELRATPVPLDGYRLHTNSDAVLWDFTTHAFCLERQDSSPPHAPVVRALIRPGFRWWPRGSTVADDNTRFGRRRSRLDWLETTAASGTLALRQRGEIPFDAQDTVISDAQVLFKTRDDALLVDPDALLTAVTRGCGFLLGQRIFVLGHEERRGNREVRRLVVSERPPSRNTLLPPLGTQGAFLENCERLLGLAVDFFLTQAGRDLAPHLALCWDTNDNSLATRIAAVSVALEGMLGLVPPAAHHVDPGFTQEDRAALDGWLAANPRLLSERGRARLQSWLSHLNQRRPRDVLESWRRRGILQVTPAEVEAWDSTRPRAAHGALTAPAPTREELQNRVTRLDRLLNLINKLMLARIGYQGEFIDYGRPGWPPAPFEAVVPELL